MTEATQPLPLSQGSAPVRLLLRLGEWRKTRTWRRFSKNRLAVIGLVVIVVLILVAIFAPFLRTVDFTDISTWGRPYEFPSAKHWMGTDSNGRDLWSRMVYGTRVAMELGLAAMALNFLIGVPLGTLSAVGGRVADFVVNRMIEIMSSFPTILFALILASLVISSRPVALGTAAGPAIGFGIGAIVGYAVAHLGQGMVRDEWHRLFRRLVELGGVGLGLAIGWLYIAPLRVDFQDIPGGSFTIVVFIIGLTSWIGPARLTRGQILAINHKEYVVAARALGANDWHIARHHLIPNSLGPLLVSATFAVPAAIGTEAGLSYFGLGVAPPTPTWGQLLSEGAPYLRYYWFYTAFPALAIMITMLAFSFFADGLHDVLDTTN